MMMHIEGNLMPESARQARRARRKLRSWCAVGAVYAMTLAGADLVLRAVVHGPQQSDQLAYQNLQSRAEELRGRLAAYEKDLADVRRRTELTARATNRPDWGLMLAALSAERRDGVVLTACGVEEIDEGTGVRVVISGMSLEQAQVQQYLISLEETGLFDQVTLIDTRRAIAPGGDRLAFNVAAEIAGAAATRADGEQPGGSGQAGGGR